MTDSVDTAVSARAEAGTRTSGRPLQQRAQITKDVIVEQAGSIKGAMYFHFPSKKALAQRLVQVWGGVLTDTLTRITATDETPHQQVVAIYRELASCVVQDRQVRAGLISSLEPAVDESAQVYAMWTSAVAVAVIVERAVRAGELGAASVPARLGESLCSGFVGAVRVAPVWGNRAPSAGVSTTFSCSGPAATLFRPVLRRRR